MQRTYIEAVTVETKDGGKYRVITSLEEIAEFLMVHWPREERLLSHLKARMACLDANDGTGTIEAAREAFIEAAKDADILRQTLVRPRRK